MGKINLDEIPTLGKGKVKQEGPRPIYLNFKPEDGAVYERLEKVRRKSGTAKVKGLLVYLVDNADF